MIHGHSYYRNIFHMLDFELEMKQALHLFMEFFCKAIDKEYQEGLHSRHDMYDMFHGEINSCQSLPEVERCCNAFLNAMKHALHGHLFDEATELKSTWERILGRKLTDIH